jgi:hypothetical protein
LVAANIDATVCFNNVIRPVQLMFRPADVRVHPSGFREWRMTHSTHRAIARKHHDENVMNISSCDAAYARVHRSALRGPHLKSSPVMGVTSAGYGRATATRPPRTAI